MVTAIARRVTLTTILVLCIARAAPAAEGKCTVATKGESPVAQACRRGGRAEAKKVMKGAVKAAKEKGGKFACDGCHKDVENFQLKSNAREDFKKLLELAGQAATAPAK
jgi:hypothetical protein